MKIEEWNPKHIEHQKNGIEKLETGLREKKEREGERGYDLRNETVIWAETVGIKSEREREIVLHAYRLLKTELSFLVWFIYVIVLVVCF